MFLLLSAYSLMWICGLASALKGACHAARTCCTTCITVAQLYLCILVDSRKVASGLPCC